MWQNRMLLFSDSARESSLPSKIGMITLKKKKQENKEVFLLDKQRFHVSFKLVYI